METTLIEKLDASRYKMILWFTIGWGGWFGAFIAKDLITNTFTIGVLSIFGFVGWALWFVNLLRLIKLGNLIKSDNHLKKALTDELLIHNRDKSIATGFWTFLILTVLFLGLSTFTDISALLVCEAMLFIGVLSTLISSLIYYKQ
tara:strand:- start:51213 stop:51647 length:435 start_codon:yes stop_codon:yes gene_type:complete